MAYSFLLLAAPVIVLGSARFVRPLPGTLPPAAAAADFLAAHRDLDRGAHRRRRRRHRHLDAELLRLVFGRPDRKTLVMLVAGSLVAVILHHFLEALFAALRKFRIVSTMQFCQSMCFAVISLSLLWWWRLSAESIVIGYGAACLISAVGDACFGRAGRLPKWRRPVRRGPPRVLAAAGAVRDLDLVHEFALPPVRRRRSLHAGALERAGRERGARASRPLPQQPRRAAAVDFAGRPAGRRRDALPEPRLGARPAAAGVGSAQSDVEAHVARHAGRERAVLWVRRCCSTWRSKADTTQGLAVLPWTLTYCVWYALLIVAQNYIWCAEKTKIGSMPLGIGLVANILLNLVLLPIWGLYGAVVATTLATGLALGLLYWLNRREGMELQSGLLWLSARAGRAGRRSLVGSGGAGRTSCGRAVLEDAVHGGRTRRDRRIPASPVRTALAAFIACDNPSEAKPDDVTHADRRRNAQRSTASTTMRRSNLPRPLRVMFLITSMPVGGAEMLLAELVRRLDRRHFAPEICCLKEPGPLGEVLAAEIPVHSRLARQQIRSAHLAAADAAAARAARSTRSSPSAPATRCSGAGWRPSASACRSILSALHSTGWPDGVGRLNRLLTPITDAFIAVADSHGAFLVDATKAFPPRKWS